MKSDKIFYSPKLNQIIILPIEDFVYEVWGYASGITTYYFIGEL